MEFQGYHRHRQTKMNNLRVVGGGGSTTKGSPTTAGTCGTGGGGGGRAKGSGGCVVGGFRIIGVISTVFNVKSTGGGVGGAINGTATSTCRCVGEAVSRTTPLSNAGSGVGSLYDM